MKTIVLFFFLCFPVLFWAQNGTMFKGKIVSEVLDLEGVHIINISTINGSVSNKEGYFSILAKASDTLIFSAIFLEQKKYVIRQEDMSQKLFLIVIKPNLEYLKEVVVTEYPNMNAVSLGILQKPAKVYTKAERRIKAAEVFKWYSPLLIPLGGMSVEGLINQISGRTTMLKKELIVERKELVQSKTAAYFNKKYMMDTLLIPEDYIAGFYYYIDDNVPFSNALRIKNKTQATFILHQLAVDYLILKEIPLKIEDRKEYLSQQIKEDKDEK